MRHHRVPYSDGRLLITAVIIVLLACAACDSGANPTSTPAVQATSTTAPSETPTGAATASSTQPLETPTGAATASATQTLATDLDSLVEALKPTFPDISVGDTPINQPFMSVPGYDVKLNGESLQVYEYPDEAARAKDSAKIGPEGEIPGFHVGWIDRPHFYKSGRIIVIYLGTDEKTLAALEAVLGEPFAVGPDIYYPGIPKP
jgi:hypothetical protein